MKMIQWLMFVGGITASSHAMAQPVPQEQWSDSTRLALAVCLVAEVGWNMQTEHAAISHVLAKRWRIAKASNPDATFEGMVRRYCSVHRVGDPQRLWLRQLKWEPLSEDPGFGDGVNWENYIRNWDRVRGTVDLFEKAALPDPLPQALHWGGVMDGSPRNSVLLARAAQLPGKEKVGLRNLFYAIQRRRVIPTTGVVSARLARGNT